ncbi:hypothetical protein V6U81_10530 [Micromonospora sp. CPCC 205711]|uniref:hypothetical protein n=1 Tax=Micromonospora sp. CPCC 205547 TaxID=3122400 RepID=UPI002FF01172
MTNVPAHPQWCDRQKCTAAADPAGTHDSRPVLLRPEDGEAMHVRLLMSRTSHPLALPVLTIEGYDQDPTKDPNPLSVVVLSTRQAAITVHLLRRLLRLAAADAVGSGWVRPRSPNSADQRFCS